MELCLFASTPDIAGLGFVVKVLTGTPAEVALRAVEWGYDGIEFLPDPEHLVEASVVERALDAAGAGMPVVNSGRMAVQGLALLSADAAVRRRSIQAYKRLIDFAGYFGARVGLGAARGKSCSDEALAENVLRQLAAHAEKAGAVIMLEPADPGVTSFITTVEQAMAWVRRIASPAFSIMLDTYELAESEPSIEHGIRAANGQARHIHLYDPNRWPPGVRDGGLDWPRIMRLLADFEGSGSVVLAPEGDPEPAARKSVKFLRGLL